jgi:predicted ester cyclase
MTALGTSSYMSRRERANERHVRRLLTDVVNEKQYEQIPEFCADSVRLHRPGDVVLEGIEAYTDHYRRIHAALPDFRATIQTIVVDGDTVATHCSITGTHEGELLNIEPTGTEVTFTAQILFQLGDGEIVEEFHQSDLTSLRQQLSGSQ